MSVIFYISMSLLLNLSTEMKGRNQWEEKGDKLFNNQEFLAASVAYEHALQVSEDQVTMVKLANCFVKLNDPDQVVEWFHNASEKGPIRSEDKYLFAMALARKKRYDEAIYWLEIYAHEKSTDSRAQRFLKAMNQRENFFTNQSLYTIRNLEINSPKNDFSPAFFGEALVFLSNRQQSALTENLHLWDQQPFLQIYHYNAAQEEVSLFNKLFNGPYHEGPVSFNTSYDYAIITRNQVKGHKPVRGDDGVVRLSMYESWLENGKWTVPVPFIYNDKNYSVGHPSLSSDGNYMIYVSDQSGGFGGTDLYVTSRNGDGQWGNPVNLGEKVNTEGNEMFPFLHQDGTLYYASDGHGGMGGLDIFEAGITPQLAVSWNRNAGAPLNSSDDDFGYIINGEKTFGYFTSNREGGLGSDDIYAVKINAGGWQLSGVIIDSHTSEPLANTRLRILYGDEEIKYLLTDENGYFTSFLTPGKEYRLISKKLDYKTHKEVLSQRIWGNNGVTRLTIAMEPADLLLTAKALGKYNFKPVHQEVDVSLTNETSGKSSRIPVDRDGEFEYELEPESKYILKISKDNYFTLSKKFSTGDLNDKKNFEYDLKMEEIVVDKPIRIENIYYDYDQFHIRQDALPELDKIFQLLLDNPLLKVEISSHTDSRGEGEYNRALSQKRAEAVVNYFVSRGIPQSRLRARGYGENRLLNYCSGFVKCSEEDHQVNRRTEFTVIGRIGSQDNINGKK